MQTCRRHPNAGRFARTCPGCTQELYDIEVRNRAEVEARTALTLIGMAAAEILDVLATETTLIVATRNPSSAACEFAVDAFRLPGADETDPELASWARRTPGQWILDWQAGDHTADAVPQMIADARQDLARTGLPVPALPQKSDVTAGPRVILVELPTRPALPATQADASRVAAEANDAFWDHAIDCEACLNARDTRTSGGKCCRTGAALTQKADDAATVADDFDRLDHWYRRGGCEKHHANDLIAT